MRQAISATTRIPQAEPVREAVDSLIQKHQGTVSDDLASLVDSYLEDRRTVETGPEEIAGPRYSPFAPDPDVTYTAQHV